MAKLVIIILALSCASAHADPKGNRWICSPSGAGMKSVCHEQQKGH
jgi:hypothetical protein